jgi:hypothetical protein
MKNIREQLDEVLYEISSVYKFFDKKKTATTRTADQSMGDNDRPQTLITRKNDQSMGDNDLPKPKPKENFISNAFKKMKRNTLEFYDKTVQPGVDSVKGAVERRERYSEANEKKPEKKPEVGIKHVIGGTMLASALGLGANALYKKYKKKKEREKSKKKLNLN